MPKFIKDLGTKLPPSGKVKHRKRKYLVECTFCGRQYELNAQDYNRNPEGERCNSCKNTKYTDEDLHRIARQFSYRNEFQTKARGPYSSAFSRGILEEVCSHMQAKYKDTSVLDPVKGIKGIYILYQEEEIVYVGKSTKSIGNRIISHKTKPEEKKQFTKAVCYEVLNKSDLHVAEVYLINKYKPFYNSDAIAEEPLTLVIDNIDSIINATFIFEDISLVF